jgi:Zn-dependent protease
MHFETAVFNVALLWLLTVPHEFAHAWAATRLGDDTPKREGRLTLYPLAHVDWIGTVILPGLTSLAGAGFLGWGKPVNTNLFKLRWGLKGLALVAVAGPFSNVLFAVVLASVARALLQVWPQVSQFAGQACLLSLYLAIFNLVPVPPLDGSKLLLAARLPVFIYNELARFGLVFLVLAMSAAGLSRWIYWLSVRGVQVIFALLR